jgi:hypothetical protein
MNKYETELRQIADSEPWSIEQLPSLERAFEVLVEVMEELVASPGWSGVSADAASAQFKAYKSYFAELADYTNRLNNVLDKQANPVRHRAQDMVAALPSATVPQWIKTAAAVAGALTVWVPGVGILAANTAVAQVENVLRYQREKKAYDSLVQLQPPLEEARKQIAVRPNPRKFPEPPPPDYPKSDSGRTIPHYYGGGGSGGGGGGSSSPKFSTYPEPPEVPTIIEHPGLPKPWDPPAVDGPTVGMTPDQYHAAGFGSGPSAGGGFGAGGGLGGLGVAAGSGAALVAGSKLSGGGLGSGGLGGGAAGAGAGAGGRGANNSMMGHPGGSGGSNSKDKRSSLGLMAPKLEDDETTINRSAGARAGGRDQSSEDGK